jgi:hypothetical protein
MVSETLYIQSLEDRYIKQLDEYIIIIFGVKLIFKLNDGMYVSSLISKEKLTNCLLSLLTSITAKNILYFTVDTSGPLIPNNIDRLHMLGEVKYKGKYRRSVCNRNFRITGQKYWNSGCDIQ